MAALGTGQREFIAKVTAVPSPGALIPCPSAERKEPFKP